MIALHEKLNIFVLELSENKVYLERLAGRYYTVDWFSLNQWTFKKIPEAKPKCCLSKNKLN